MVSTIKNQKVPLILTRLNSFVTREFLSVVIQSGQDKSHCLLHKHALCAIWSLRVRTQFVQNAYRPERLHDKKVPVRSFSQRPNCTEYFRTKKSHSHFSHKFFCPWRAQINFIQKPLPKQTLKQHDAILSVGTCPLPIVVGGRSKHSSQQCLEPSDDSCE